MGANFRMLRFYISENQLFPTIPESLLPWNMYLSYILFRIRKAYRKVRVKMNSGDSDEIIKNTIKI